MRIIRYHATGMNPDLARVIDAIKRGAFGSYETFTPLIDTLTIGGDYYLISHDFASCTHEPIVIKPLTLF